MRVNELEVDPRKQEGRKPHGRNTGPESQGSDCREIYFRAKDNNRGPSRHRPRVTFRKSRRYVAYGERFYPAIRTLLIFHIE